MDLTKLNKRLYDLQVLLKKNFPKEYYGNNWDVTLYEQELTINIDDTYDCTHYEVSFDDFAKYTNEQLIELERKRIQKYKEAREARMLKSKEDQKKAEYNKYLKLKEKYGEN